MSVKAACYFVGLLAGASTAVAAAPAWQGLDVTVENLPSSTRVNGVAIATTRIVGPGVPALAARLERQWSSESGSVMARWTVVGPWRVLSRARGSLSQVLQLPDRYGAHEALLSQIDVSSRPVAAPAPAVHLPQLCNVMNTVHSDSGNEESLQLVASCRIPASTVAAQLRVTARAGGLLELASTTPFLAHWRGDGLQISAVITSESAPKGAAKSTLVLQQQRVR